MNSGLNSMSYDELVDLFWSDNTCGFSRLSIVVAIGNLFWEHGGKDPQTEFFLRTFLLDTTGEGPLAKVLAGTSDREKSWLYQETLEGVFAFLEACRDNLSPETVAILDRYKANPPYPEFDRGVKNKIRHSGLGKRLAGGELLFPHEVVYPAISPAP